LEVERCPSCRAFNPWFADYCHNCGNPIAIEASLAKPIEKVVYLEDPNLKQLDEAVLAIIKLRDGSISISEVSAMLGVRKETLQQSIDRLQHSHLIQRP
jgi:Holliday junction resolvasome RuvABC ATP-dependent DNA helicase subunit